MSAPENGRAVPAAPISTVLSAEQVRVATEWVQSGAVRLTRRVVSETRSVEVTVRREILVVETMDITATSADGMTWVGTNYSGPAVPAPTEPPPLIFVLREEVPEVRTTVRAYEQATVQRRLARRDVGVTSSVRHEEIAADPTTSQ